VPHAPDRGACADLLLGICVCAAVCSGSAGLAPGDHSTLFALARLYYLPVLLVRTLAGPVSESSFCQSRGSGSLGAVLTGSALALAGE